MDRRRFLASAAAAAVAPKAATGWKRVSGPPACPVPDPMVIPHGHIANPEYHIAKCEEFLVGTQKYLHEEFRRQKYLRLAQEHL